MALVKGTVLDKSYVDVDLDLELINHAEFERFLFSKSSAPVEVQIEIYQKNSH